MTLIVSIDTGTLVGIIGIIVSLGAYFLVTKRNNLKINQKNKTGNNTISNSTVANEKNNQKK